MSFRWRRNPRDAGYHPAAATDPIATNHRAAVALSVVLVALEPGRPVRIVLRPRQPLEPPARGRIARVVLEDLVELLGALVPLALGQLLVCLAPLLLEAAGL